MPRSRAYLLLPLLTMVCAYGAGCSSAARQQPGALLALSLSSTTLYDQLAQLPKSGPGSLAAGYAQIGALSFTQYFAFLSASAPDRPMMLDGVALGNPKTLLATQQTSFEVMDVLFPRVSDWWQLSGVAPKPFASYEDYKAQLNLPESSAGLALKPADYGCFSLPNLVVQSLGLSLWQWLTGPRGPAANPTERRSSTDRNRIGAIRQTVGQLPPEQLAAIRDRYLRPLQNQLAEQDVNQMIGEITDAFVTQPERFVPEQGSSCPAAEQTGQAESSETCSKDGTCPATNEP